MTASLSFLTRPGKPELAYVFSPAGENGKDLPVVMFLGGFRSDMEGTKATYLEERARERGQGFLRFDYTGHGKSGGAFKDGTVGIWKQDAFDMLNHVTKDKQPVLLVGSSMGGWIALMIALERSSQVRGVLGIAAAPDFTRWIDERMTPAQRRQMDEQGFVEEENDYGEPYVFTRSFIEEAQKHFLLGHKYTNDLPIRLIQGVEDKEVPWRTAIEIEKAFVGGAVDVVLIEDGDHRLSRPEDLELIDKEIKSLSGVIG